MGASQDFEFEGTRRMIVTPALLGVGLEDKILDKPNVDLVGEFNASPFKSGRPRQGCQAVGPPRGQVTRVSYLGSTIMAPAYPSSSRSSWSPGAGPGPTSRSSRRPDVLGQPRLGLVKGQHPLLRGPDADSDTTYYYRWELVTKHSLRLAGQRVFVHRVH